jgi:hypothetical protein
MAATEEQRQWVSKVLGVDTGEAADPELRDLADQNTYRAYLASACKRLRSSGSASFGIVLGKKRQEHRLLLHPTKPAKSLATSLAAETGLHAMTWGTAMPSADKATIMQLTLEGRQLPGLKKKTDQLLKAFRPLPFAKVSLAVDGVAMADTPDPDYEDNEDLPVSELPDAPATLPPQGQALSDAARNGNALCEECEVARRSQADREAVVA